MAQENSHEARVSERLQPPAPITVRFDSYIRSHECWVSQPPIPSKNPFAQRLGRLSDLRIRVHCKTCQGIFRLLNDSTVQKEHGEVDPFCVIQRLDGQDSYALSAVNSLDPLVYMRNVRMYPLDEYEDFQNDLILHREWVDLNEIKEWAEDCSKNHGACCLQPKDQPMITADTTIPEVVFIDVIDNCLYKSDIREPFLALSYVWGPSAAKLQLTLKNAATLHIPGAFQKLRSQIPCTIYDSMLLTRGLGFRYLWVDQLCIVQDDPGDVSRLISQMVTIYESASITIVAADGLDSNHGLGGLQGGLPREKGPYHIVTLTQSQQFLAYRQLSVPKKYFSRCWTYQEWHFSKRLLVFIEGTIVWKCEQKDTQERISRRWSLPISLHDSYRLPGKFLDESHERLSWPDLTRYSWSLWDYNQRNLSHDSDVLSAFAGVICAFNPYFPGGFLQGLPELYFDLALLWQPDGALRRRKPNDSSISIPSWSWVGWEGSLDLDMWQEGILRPNVATFNSMNTFPVTTWYKSQDPAIPGTAISNSYHRYHKLRPKSAKPRWSEHLVTKKHLAISSLRKIEDTEPDLSGWELKDWYPDSLAVLDAYDDPIRYHHASRGVDLLYPLPMQGTNPIQSPELRYLHFNAHRGYFKRGAFFTRGPAVDVIDLSYYPSTLLEDEQGEVAGVLRLVAGEAGSKEQNDYYELVAISEGQFDLELEEGEDSADRHFFMEELRQPTYIKRLREIRTSGYESPESDEDPDRCRLGERTIIYEWYNVLWIKWIDGIAYRKACGRVIKQVWGTQNFEAIDVVLG